MNWATRQKLYKNAMKRALVEIDQVSPRNGGPEVRRAWLVFEELKLQLGEYEKMSLHEATLREGEWDIIYLYEALMDVVECKDISMTGGRRYAVKDVAGKKHSLDKDFHHVWARPKASKT